MIYTNFEQRSADWLQMRTGCCTASRGKDMLSANKDTRGNYRDELVFERLTGDVFPHFKTPAMQEGIDDEPLANAEYEFRTGNEVTKVGLAVHDSIKWFCASPDGLVGDDGMVEYKRLQPKNHIKILSTGVIPAEYQIQMDCQMSCTGRQWCDFVSHCPPVMKDGRPTLVLPEHLQLHVIRYLRDDAVIRGHELKIQYFLNEVAEMTQRLSKGEYMALQEVVR